MRTPVTATLRRKKTTATTLTDGAPVAQGAWHGAEAHDIASWSREGKEQRRRENIFSMGIEDKMA
jgi:hypothetical protein